MASILCVVCLWLFSGMTAHGGTVLTDGLGRRVGEFPARMPPKRRQVAIFYWTWHAHFSKQLPPRNNAQIIQEHPEARNDFAHPAWENTPSGTSYHWDEPLFGYYSSADMFVLRKHASLLADAGVDAVIFDATNGTFTWKDGYDPLLEAFSQAMKDGVRSPKFAFMLNFAPNANTAQELRMLYQDIYKPGRHRELWYFWDGKPLIMAHPKALDPKSPLDAEILAFFTFRKNEPTYFVKDIPYESATWGWCSVFPQAHYGMHGSWTEEMTVSVAQNASVHGLVAMNDFRGGVFGRGYASGEYRAMFPLCNGTVAIMTRQNPQAWQWGLNFQQQWDRAILLDPDMVFVTGWNEWIAGRHSVWQGTENAFPDQYSPEFSRDAEPSAGILKDHFYCQLVANIRRYKGGRRAFHIRKSQADPLETPEEWTKAQTLRDYANDTPARYADGWQGIHFNSPAQPNDILACNVLYDDENLYFRVETAKPISKPDGQGWMRLLMDLTGKAHGEWEGFHYTTAYNVETDRMDVRKFTGHEAQSVNVGEARYIVHDKVLMVAIPRKCVECDGDEPPTFGFKWCDGQSNPEDIMQVYTQGDAAPDARFRYTISK